MYLYVRVYLCREAVSSMSVSSKGLAWGGPKLNSFFSFIGVGVAVEVWLHPCVGNRFPCVDDVYDSRV